jgi:GMP synthase-like glutamine amidotransferase
MKWLKRFNESSYSIFDSEGWKKILPEKLILVTSTGNWELKLPQENYTQITPSSQRGEVLKDGEPDHLGIDIDIMKDNDGTSANPDTLKLNVSISYGDAMSAEFTIGKPNKVDVINYNGFNSQLDPKTCFGFEDESISGLVNFFNSWGYELNKTDFTFLDKYLNSYKPQNESIEIKTSFDDDYILVFRGVKYKVASNPNEIQKINNEYNILGTISTGSEFRVSKREGNGVQNLKALEVINCPHFLICYAFQSLGEVSDNNKNVKGNYILTDYTNHPLFKGVELETTQFSFDFNDILNECPKGFEVIGKLDGEIAAVVNDDKKIWATLFHPEDIEDTYVVLDNFLDICNYSPESKIDYLKGGGKVDNNIVERYNDFIKRLN